MRSLLIDTAQWPRKLERSGLWHSPKETHFYAVQLAGADSPSHWHPNSKVWKLYSLTLYICLNRKMTYRASTTALIRICKLHFLHAGIKNLGISIIFCLLCAITVCGYYYWHLFFQVFCTVSGFICWHSLQHSPHVCYLVQSPLVQSVFVHSLQNSCASRHINEKGSSHLRMGIVFKVFSAKQDPKHLTEAHISPFPFITSC
jgi:hypothetical protein